MKPRFVIVTLVVLGLVFTANYAQAQTLKKQIVGTWSVAGGPLNVLSLSGAVAVVIGPPVCLRVGLTTAIC
jgi:hypothetical protein